MPLSDLVVRNAKPRERDYKMFDEQRLYLLVKANGTRCWRLDYDAGGKRKTMALGTFPEVTLKQARTLRDEARDNLRSSGDPKGQAEPERKSVTTFGTVAEQWLVTRVIPESAQATIEKTEWLLRFVVSLNDRDITTIEAPEVLELIRRVEAQGRHHSARRLRTVCSRVFRFGIASGVALRDPCADIAGALMVAPKEKHRAAPLTPSAIGALMRAIGEYKGHPAVGVAMRFGAITFVRPGELRMATWSEIDLDQALWTIPAERMKMKRLHYVPLSRQAVSCLERLKTFYEPKGLLFPSLRSDQRPISENTVNAALRNLGFSKEQATHHGFRRMASTVLNEAGWNFDWVERQLAHVEENKVRGAYNAAEYLEGRTQMMQAWADMLDQFENDDLIG